ncbi:MAG TPA: polysaccharide biosynthesis/export family protein [Pirellulales bacterium]|nr:polysaccharide biosynthesis/export family protein [Pirellulales bacterium]
MMHGAPTHFWSSVAWGFFLLCTVLSPGCSSGGGSFTLFPGGDYLSDETKFVRRRIPTDLPPPRELRKIALPSYLIQPGDQILVEPLKLDSTLRFPADQTVMPDGTIDLGGFGRRIVAGKTIEQIETDVSAAIKAIEPNPEPINVRLVNPQSALYYVLGEVNSPGSFPLIGRETVLDGIIAAGGLGDKASPCNIILSRPTPPDGCRIVVPICYRQITQLGDTTTNLQLMPGDRIYVATRTFCEGLTPNGRSCPLCQKRQCPCPRGSTLFPALTTYAPSESEWIGPSEPEPVQERPLEQPSRGRE